MQLRLLAFKHILIFISPHLRVILNSIFGVKYLVVSFPKGHEYTKDQDKQVLLNSLKYTSLGCLIHFKMKVCFIAIKLSFFQKREGISSDLETSCIWVHIVVVFAKWYMS